MVSVTENVERLLALITQENVDADAFNFVRDKLVKMIESPPQDETKAKHDPNNEDRWHVIERSIAP